jgi:hypothetical protein
MTTIARRLVCFAFWTMVACSSSSSTRSPITNPQSCSSDGDCPNGQGCHLQVPTDGYCTPLCTCSDGTTSCDNDVAVDCPVQNQCKGSTDAPKPECKEVGKHEGKGVCDLFNGAYGPKTCNP